MNLADWAEDTARTILQEPLPRRWAHSQGVAAQARTLASILGPDTDLLTAASLHVNACLPRSLFLEYNVSDNLMLREITKNPIPLEKDGTMAVPQGPGLGIEMDEKAIEKEAREQLGYAKPGEYVYVAPAPTKPVPPANHSAKR